MSSQSSSEEILMERQNSATSLQSNESQEEEELLDQKSLELPQPDAGWFENLIQELLGTDPMYLMPLFLSTGEDDQKPKVPVSMTEEYVRTSLQSSDKLEEWFTKALHECHRNLLLYLLSFHRPSHLLKILLTWQYQNTNHKSHPTTSSTPNDFQPTLMMSKQSLDGSAIFQKDYYKSYNPQKPPHYSFDAQLAVEAQMLLGSSLSPLSPLTLLTLQGEEELALCLLQFLCHHLQRKQQRLLLMEFVGRVWGEGNVVLHLASFMGMEQLVSNLVEIGVGVQRKNQKGFRPVDCADTDSVRKLFRKHTSPTERIQAGRTRKRSTSESNPQQPIIEILQPVYKTSMKHLPAMQSQPHLLDKKKKLSFDNRALIFEYCKTGDFENFEKILSENPSIDLNEKTGQGMTCLHLSCAFGHLNLVQKLLSLSNIQINSQDNEGWTPLHALLREIPLPPTDKLTSPNQKRSAMEEKEEIEKRQKYLEILKLLLNRKDLDLQILTFDGESVYEMIRSLNEDDEEDDDEEEDSKDLDLEVFDMIQKRENDKNFSIETKQEEPTLSKEILTIKEEEEKIQEPIEIEKEVEILKPKEISNKEPVKEEIIKEPETKEVAVESKKEKEIFVDSIDKLKLKEEIAIVEKSNPISIVEPKVDEEVAITPNTARKTQIQKEMEERVKQLLINQERDEQKVRRKSFTPPGQQPTSSPHASPSMPQKALLKPQSVLGRSLSSSKQATSLLKPKLSAPLTTEEYKLFSSRNGSKESQPKPPAGDDKEKQQKPVLSRWFPVIQNK